MRAAHEACGVKCEEQCGENNFHGLRLLVREIRIVIAEGANQAEA